MRYLDADEPSKLPPIRADRISRRAATAGPDAGRAPENENQTDSLLPESALENALQPELPYRHGRDRLRAHRNRRRRLPGYGGTVRPDDHRRGPAAHRPFVASQLSRLFLPPAPPEPPPPAPH